MPAMAMAMATLAACAPSTSLALLPGAPPRTSGNAALTSRTSRTLKRLSLVTSSSSQCSRTASVLARAEASEGGMRDHVPRDDQDGSLGLPSCLEVAEDGSRYLHVMASSMHNVDHGTRVEFCDLRNLQGPYGRLGFRRENFREHFTIGCIIGLTCLPITKGHSSVQNLEFPLFLNALAASPIRIAVEKGGLPHALEEMGNLNDLDLQKIYVSSFSNVRGGGDFLVLDERTDSKTMVASTFPQAIAVALRYRQPFFLKLETLLSANGDFIDRMLINPLARDQDGDVEWLAELSKSMHIIVGNQSRLQTALKYAVDSEQYEEALRLKQELISYDIRMNHEAVKVLQRLRTLYLERMGIFYKL